MTLLKGNGLRSLTLLGPSLRPVAEKLAKMGVACRVVETPSPLATLLAGSTDRAFALASLLDNAEVASSPVSAQDTPADGTSSASSQAAIVPQEVSTSGAAEVTGDAEELYVAFGSLRWRVRGADRAKTPDVLRVALSVTEEGSGRFHLDTIDLCQAKARAGFIDAAASELHADADILRRQLGEVLFATEGAVSKNVAVDDTVQMNSEEREAALALLGDPQLCQRIVADLGVLGIVGEETNLLVTYLATVLDSLSVPSGWSSSPRPRRGSPTWPMRCSGWCPTRTS